MRTASRERGTKETSVAVTVDLDGTGRTDVATGIPFYDHMLDQLGRHGGFDLTVHADGDLHIDTHHTVEDVAITLGEAFAEALGDKAGVRRFASGLYPLDEALVEVALDLSGRPFVAWDVPMPESLPLGNPAFDPQLAEHAVSSFATNAGITLHVSLRVGPQHPPHHRGDVQGPRPLPARRGACRRRRPRSAVDEGCVVTAPLIAVVDYGIGNLHSAQKALARLGADARLTDDPALIADAAAVVLPGVGSFGACMGALRDAGLEDPVIEAAASGRPFLGICVGMQMLFSASEESPGVTGLGVIPGVVRWIPATSRSRRCSGTSSTCGLPTTRCSPVSASRRGSTSSTRCTGCRTTAAVTATCEYGVDAERRVPGRDRSPPCSSTRRSRRPAGLALLGNFVGTSPATASAPPSS